MPQFIMHSDHASYVGMDVHSRSISVAALDLKTGETRRKRFCSCPSASEIAEWCLGWMSAPIYFAYESGPCGFRLKRDLESLGHDCDVIAVSSIARSAEDKLLKDDRRDALRLLSAITKAEPGLKTVYMPAPRVEALRDLVRERNDAVMAFKRSKQLVSAMLVRYGLVWNERTRTGSLATTWTRRHIAWMESLSFGDPVADAVFARYVATAKEDAERVKRIEAACREQTKAPDVKPYVDALSRLIGVGMIGALVFYSSMGDFERFENGRSVSSYYGLTPKRHNSGEKGNNNGRITKAGDTLCRKTLLEGLSGALMCSARTHKPIREGQIVSPSVEAEAKKCNARYRRRFQHLLDQGKHPNVAKVAVASELVRDIWVIGRMVQRELRED